ncbi:DUF4249 family protein [Halocola ammonii]
MMKKAFLIALLFIGLLGCERDPDIHEQWEKVIAVEAMLTVGQEVHDIRLKHLENGDFSAEAIPISDAHVLLSTPDSTYALNYNSQTESYQKEGLLVEASTTYHLKIEYRDQILESTTTTPPELQLQTSSEPFYDIDPDAPDTTVMKVWWNSIPSSHYILHLRSLEEDPEPIFFQEDYPGFNELHFEPTTDNSFAMKVSELEYYGWHQLDVVAVNEKYTAIYDYNTQGDQNILEQGPSNIENGYGFFTGVSCSHLKFYVMQ